MAFPSDPVVGQMYSLNGVRWYFDGDQHGWYRAYTGANGELIKSYAPVTIFSALARISALESQLELIQSKNFLELE